MNPITQIASEILEDLQLVSESIPRPREINARDVVAQPNRTMVGGPDLEHEVHKITDAERRALQYLRAEPFLIRVIAEELPGNTRASYLFCRAAPPPRSAAKYGTLASYRNNGLGIIAECPVGEIVEIELPYGVTRELRIVERVRLRAHLDDEGWDGHDNVIEPASIRSVPSLRELLRRLRVPLGPALDDIFAEVAHEKDAAADRLAASEGSRREARRTLSLRDQAILDKFQGQIFRMPLGQRIFLSGPAGTGKTTTLIKRLGQKLDTQFWDVVERDRIGTADPSGWVMFTPTELLKLYLKEAFAREQVPAPDSCVKTWAAERNRLGRDVFGILKTETGGVFYLKEQPLLRAETSAAVWALYASFQAFVETETVARFTEAFAAVDASAAPGELRDAVSELRLRAGGASIAYDKVFELVSRQAVLAKHKKALDEQLDAAVKKVVRTLLARHPTLVNELASRVEGLMTSGPAPDDEEDDQEDAAVLSSASERARALHVLMKALPALAAERQQSIKRSTRYGAVITFLGERVPSEAELAELDRLSIVKREVAFLAATHKALTDGLPASFQRFSP